MAWSAPMTAVDGSVFTAAQFNTNVRDNLNETAPSKATTLGSYFTTLGVNSVQEAIPDNDTVGTVDTTSSTSYGDLASNGPSVSAHVNAFAIVFLYAGMRSNSSSGSGAMSVEVSGATSISASDGNSLKTAGDRLERHSAVLFLDLNQGDHTIKCKYRALSSTQEFRDRRLSILVF